MPTYNKLIRDRIPEIIENDNKKFRIRILDKDEFEEEVVKKIHEEYQELVMAETSQESLEELADILELIHAVAKIHGTDIDVIDRIRLSKKEKRGGFDKQIFLIDVED